MKEKITRIEAAKIIGITYNTLYQWGLYRKGYGPECYTDELGNIYYVKSEVESFATEYNNNAGK